MTFPYRLAVACAVFLVVLEVGVYGALQHGNNFANGVLVGSSATCSNSSHKGTLQTTAGGVLQVCNGQTWENVVTNTQTASDSDLLDGLDSSDFLRSGMDISLPRGSSFTHGEIRTWTSEFLTANGVNSCEYEVARFVINSHHWSSANGFVVELFHRYFDKSGYSRWLIEAGYQNEYSLELLESYGRQRGSARLRLDDRTEMETYVGDYVNYEIPMYVQVRHYSRWVMRVTSMFREVTQLSAPGDVIYTSSPACNEIGIQSQWSDSTYPAKHSGYHYFPKVGIADTDPSTWGSHALYVSGSAYAVGTWTSSDERFKKDIEGIDNALDKVEKLQGRRFRWRNDEFPGRGFHDRDEVGFIAQEVEAVLPELVMKNGEEEYRSVAYDRVGAVLVEAVKELRDEVRSLRSELAEERAARARLEEKVAHLLQEEK